MPDDRRLKVLHVIENLGRGGAERLLLGLLPILQSRGVRTEVAMLGCRDDLAGDMRGAGVPVHVLGLESLRRGAKAIRSLVGLIQDTGYDLIHTHLPHANLYGRLASRIAGIPATTSYHNTDYEPEALLDNPIHAKWKQRAHQMLDFMMTPSSPKVVAVSEFVAQSIVRRLRFKRSQVTVIHNGVLSSSLEPRTPDIQRKWKQTLGLPLDSRIAVQVGRFSPQKGQVHTIRAAALLHEQRDVLWVLVGDGPGRGCVEEEIRRNGVGDTVRLVGVQEDVTPYLLASDVFVFPSLHEGLGIAVLEAMAVGLPVVAYRAGPLPEVVDDRRTGILVDSGNHRQLSAAIDSLLNDERKARAMGEEGRDRIKARFLVEETATRHFDLYRELLGSQVY